jgi:spermidine dehydrogenase
MDDSPDPAHDRELGLDQPIPRRDFINGLAVGIGALAALSPSEWLRAGLSQQAAGYPPAKTGLRGSHDGAFETAHRLRDGFIPPEWRKPAALAERYDLIVVGAGISGLAAAWFFRKAAGSNARILILDNHDDFGGHARRTEFTVDGRTLIGYGGTQSIDGPSHYSVMSRTLLRDLGIDTEVFRQAFDQQYFTSRGLSHGVFFDKSVFGQDRLVPKPERLAWRDFAARTPLAPDARAALVRLHGERRDHLRGQTPAQKLALLRKTSYRDYLTKHARVPASLLPYLQTTTHGYYGVGIDAVPAADCWGLGYPGFAGLGLAEGRATLGRTAAQAHDEPYIFHFPDGNASIARLLVRQMIPGVLDGSTMRDIVTARARYEKLDAPASRVRLRLDSTVINVAHRAPGGTGEVDVTYVRGGKAYRVRGAKCVLACWHGVIPHLCPELPPPQKEALRYGAKVPLLYTNVALRNWTALAKLGVHSVEAPGAYWSEVAVDYPVSLGSHSFAKGPADPVILFMMRAPCKPGLSARDQHRIGRTELLATAWATYERQIRDQLARMFGAGGFDPARDIAGITVNRWSHGYAYEYNSLWDPDWPKEQQPCVIARQRHGNIAIANSDAGAYAYTDSAIDQAWRAVGELR